MALLGGFRLFSLFAIVAFVTSSSLAANSSSADSAVAARHGFTPTLRDLCIGTDAGMTIVEDTMERKIQALKNRYENCQYVNGNLEITGLDSEEYYNTDLSFLNSIREVTGYVLIANVYAQNVTLENLTIIRGDTLFTPHKTAGSNSTDQTGYALFVTLNYRRENASIGMRLLGLQNLAEISNGDVFFENNNLLCYATTDIYWRDIFADSSKQKVSFSHDTVQSTQPCNPKCHDKCEETVPTTNSTSGGSSIHKVTQKFCWGPGPKNCQKMNKVTCAEQCKGGRCFGTEPNECCHPQCAAGCNGPSKYDCWGCRSFHNDGGCEPYCPSQQIYNSTIFKWVQNPDGKFAFGKLCVEKCPDNFLEHKGGCVKSCPMNYQPVDAKCVECSSGNCPKRCIIDWPKSMDFLHSGNIDQLEGCTSVDGHIKIFDATIRGDPYNNIDPMPLSELYKLQSIQEITEFLMIQSLNGWGVTNFTFFNNLQAILGRKLDSYGTALNIIGNGDLEFLGFNSLRKISSGHVIVESNTKLCYMDDLEVTKLFKMTTRQTSFIRFNANNREHCLPRGYNCHQECRNGCWGPGPSMCLNCQHYRYKDECLNNCSRPMLYSVSDNNKECFDCSPECLSGCTGSATGQCDACRNFKDGPFCVSKCPRDDLEGAYKYPDETGNCQPCHPTCIDGCTGPDNSVGPNGCNMVA